MSATRATVPVLRALLDQARRKDYSSGVLGVRARPEWPGPATFTHADVPVTVAPCESALAVREALLDRVCGQWLVVLTDRPEDDLGAGVLSHLVWHRLRTPDPWDAVRLRFAATGVDPVLTTVAGDREIAGGLLLAAPPAGWPPAPGGVLTRDHALGAVAAAQLHLTDPVVDAASVLAWTADPLLSAWVADLRALAGDALTGAVIAWAAERSGVIGPPLLHLLRAGEGHDAVPLGLAAGVLAAASERVDDDAGQATLPAGQSATGQSAGGQPRLAREALIRLEPRLGGSIPAAGVLRSWADEASAVVTGMLAEPVRRGGGEVLLARADGLLAAIHGSGLADLSDLLPSGLTRRFASLAGALRTAVTGSAGDVNPDRPQVPGTALDGVERGWAAVASHRLAESDPRTPAFHGAVRLARWLATDTTVAGTSLAVLLDRHGDADAWADSAVNDAAPGASDPELGSGLAAVLGHVRSRRAAHDLAFGAALAAHTGDDPDTGPCEVWHLEDLLPSVVLPLARKTPVLLLVMDGMSAGVCTEIMTSVLARTTDGWAEALLSGQTRRAAALAVLPTLTEVSRASLLSGNLRTGGQDVEQRSYEALTRAHGLPGAKLFHKKPLDSSRLGYAVADDVAAAIANVTAHPLVTCVLNTIDDALDRSDPGGTAWGADTVKHLLPLLDRARHAGRAVVVTADHGHVVERRQGTQRSYASISSARSRAALEPAAEGEVLVAGRRVLMHEGRAVLAVDEHLRYGPLKAGYHGGAAPAEAVVPVAFLVSGPVPEDVGLYPAPPQEPAWWLDPLPPAPPAGTTGALSGRTGQQPTWPSPAAGPVPGSRTRRKDSGSTLFDEPAQQPISAAPSNAPAMSPAAAAVVASPTYAAQKKVAGRVSVTDGQVRDLLGALLAAQGQRLAAARAATALAVPTATVRGAILHTQRLLNVEGNPVLRVDADGSTVVLDEALLREQFGIRT
ncbi:MAG TPA: BREX-2 system phosphatase PglZ [Streptosporangiaceae bacterium]|nr:BREX-2 system phosphatase PglZ [Streptosporangiaceae bacterium]